MNSYIAYAIIIVGLFTAFMAFSQLLKRNRMRERLQTVDSYAPDEEDDGAPPVFVSFCEGMLRLIGIDVKNQKEATLLLAQAGITSPYGITYFMFFKKIVQPIIFILGAFFFIKTIGFASHLSAWTKASHLIIALMLMTAGFYGAKIYVTNAKQRRQQILTRTFPEALDLLLVCIESGLGLDAALARVCGELRESYPVVASELDRTRIELTVMSDRSQALQNLADRTQIIPFRSLVAALIQTEKFGTSLVDTLRVLSDDMRTTRLLIAENRAARIPALITIPLIVCILPAFIMIILGPPFVRVIDQGGIFGGAENKPVQRIRQP